MKQRILHLGEQIRKSDGCGGSHQPMNQKKKKKSRRAGREKKARKRGRMAETAKEESGGPVADPWGK